MVQVLSMIAISLLLIFPAKTQPHLTKCGVGKRVDCVVDGDTLYVDGVKYRMAGYDTPEPQSNICGGLREKKLAAKATARFIDLLNNNRWMLIKTGKKGHFGRDLVHIRIRGRDVGDILISERLARRWPDGREWWCK